MPITFFQRDPAGEVDSNPQVVKINTTDDLAAVTTAGYFNHYISAEGWLIKATDMCLIAYDGGEGFFTVSISNGVITLSQNSSGGTAGAKAASDNTSPTVASVEGAPVVSGNLVTFSDTAGSIGDSGIAPGTASGKAASDNTKPTVASVGSAVVANHIALFQDTSGTIDDTAGTAINNGPIQAGLSGTAGTLGSFPAAATSGELILAAVTNSSGNFNTTISNVAAVGQSQVVSIPDGGRAASDFVIAQSSLPSNQTTFTVVKTAGFAALATAGKINLVVHPTATAQFAVIDIKVLKSTGLSGGGGDRLLAVSDGTIVFNNAGITAALLGTPILTLWGGTGNPLAVGASEVSTAGADIFLQYAGGTTDYTAGSVQLAITFVQVTA